MTAREAEQRLRAARVVPVIKFERLDESGPCLDALAAGGFLAAEITLRTEEGLAAIARHAARADLFLGAGTVTDAGRAAAAMDCGARFIVSPHYDAEISALCRSRDVLYAGGCATPTEVAFAVKNGDTFVKFFPAQQLGGAAMLSALGAVYPKVRFFPTGGIGPEVLAEYLRLKNVAAVGGSYFTRCMETKAILEACQRTTDVLTEVNR